MYMYFTDHFMVKNLYMEPIYLTEKVPSIGLKLTKMQTSLTYRELLDKKTTQNIANNINYRHRMAQYASRASVNLHTHIFFRNQKRDETGYVLFVRQNAVQVWIITY